MRKKTKGSEGFALPQASGPSSPKDDGKRVFGTASLQDFERNSGPSTVTLAESTVKAELLRLLRLPVDDVIHTHISGNMSGYEAFARTLLRKALAEGSQSAFDAILNRVEGTPVKTASHVASNDRLDSQIDLSLSELNQLVSQDDE